MYVVNIQFCWKFYYISSSFAISFVGLDPSLVLFNTFSLPFPWLLPITNDTDFYDCLFILRSITTYIYLPYPLCMIFIILFTPEYVKKWVFCCSIFTTYLPLTIRSTVFEILVYCLVTYMKITQSACPSNIGLLLFESFITVMGYFICSVFSSKKITSCFSSFVKRVILIASSSYFTIFCYYFQ